MKMRFLFKVFLYFSFLYSFSLEDINIGDVVFAKYNGYFDFGISAYFNKKYSHSLIKTKEGLFSFTVMYAGDVGDIYIDKSLEEDKESVVVYRPIMDKAQYRVYQKCVNDYTDILADLINKRIIKFDWNLRGYKNSFICSTFVFHILKKCLPNYQDYFLIKNVDKIHYHNKRPIFYVDDALNKKKFKVVYKKGAD